MSNFVYLEQGGTYKEFPLIPEYHPHNFKNAGFWPKIRAYCVKPNWERKVKIICFIAECLDGLFCWMTLKRHYHYDINNALQCSIFCQPIFGIETIYCWTHLYVAHATDLSRHRHGAIWRIVVHDSEKERRWKSSPSGRGIRTQILQWLKLRFSKEFSYLFNVV